MKAGFSGHQDLAGSEQWISKELLNTIEQTGITSGVTSLAIGGDQLFAKVLRTLNLPYQVVVPCKGYDKTFPEHDRSTYLHLLRLAQKTTVLNFDEPSELAFYNAGMRVVDIADMLVTVWDGKPAHGLGGTADIVEFARSRGKLIIHIDHIHRSVSKING